MDEQPRHISRDYETPRRFFETYALKFEYLRIIHRLQLSRLKYQKYVIFC